MRYTHIASLKWIIPLNSSFPFLSEEPFASRGKQRANINIAMYICIFKEEALINCTRMF